MVQKDKPKKSGGRRMAEGADREPVPFDEALRGMVNAPPQHKKDGKSPRKKKAR